MIKKILHTKTPKEILPEATPNKKVLLTKVKKTLLVTPQEVPTPVKKILSTKIKKTVPSPPAPGVHVTLAMEAFENLREYYRQQNMEIPQEDIKWYHEELQHEKKEFDEFWERCAVTKAVSECVFRGDDEWTIALAENAAKQKVKALPLQESDIGPMPEYGTKEFWAWCHKRKKLKEQKDSAIIAAGEVVPVKKTKKAKTP
jgi:hypothetical protein